MYLKTFNSQLITLKLLSTINYQLSTFNSPSLHMEYLGVLVGFEYFREVLSVGVGDEDLSELLSLHHVYNPFHPFPVQPVEYIIQ